MATFTAGQVLTAAQLNAIFDPLSAMTAYTPALTNATLGNGTISGFYTQVGKLVFVDNVFVLGSTSTMGTHPRISVPVTASPRTWNIEGCAYDSSADTLYAVTGQISGSGAVIRVAAGSGEVTATVPFTWATGDNLCLSGVYEAT